MQRGWFQALHVLHRRRAECLGEQIVVSRREGRRFDSDRRLHTPPLTCGNAETVTWVTFSLAYPRRTPAERMQRTQSLQRMQGAFGLAPE